MLTAENVSVRYGALLAVDRVSVTLGAGQWLMLVGPNGAGKSTLLRAIAQGVPYDGAIRLLGEDARRIRPAALARRVGFLRQHNPALYAYTVEEVVRLGRYAHAKGLFAARDDEGEEKVERALALTGMTSLRGASVLALSGGELQRAFLAQVLAQDPQILLLDEPANHLDLLYQRQIFDLIAEWVKEPGTGSLPGRAAVSVVHDLSLARRYGTHAALMHRGKCVCQGPAQKALAGERLKEVYGMDVVGWMKEMAEVWE